MGIMSRDIGVDLGTSNIRIFVRGRGIVVSEPSVVAINKITGEVLAIGTQAKEMLGRTPDNIIAIKPLKEGVIADFEATRMLLQTLIEKVMPKSLLSRPRLVISIPSGITDVEERAVQGVAYKSGARDVFTMEEVMSAAIGSGLNIEHPEGAMIVNIGGGTSEMAVLSLGGIVVCNSVKVAGEKFDKDIVEYVKKKFSMLIGDTEAEEVKKQIGAAVSTMTEEKTNVKGRSLTTGLPQTVTLTTQDINDAISDSLSEIIRVVKLTLEQTPPEISSDVMEKGIVVSGGSSQLKNIDRFISDATGMPVYIADNPLDCVIKGLGVALGSIEVLKKTAKAKKR